MPALTKGCKAGGGDRQGGEITDVGAVLRGGGFGQSAGHQAAIAPKPVGAVKVPHVAVRRMGLINQPVHRRPAQVRRLGRNDPRRRQDISDQGTSHRRSEDKACLSRRAGPEAL